jgi:hypothetical protein
MKLRHALVVAAILVACGPQTRKQPPGGEVDSGACTPGAVENTPATCGDGIDNDCNGKIDCQDPSCSGIGACPICGTVEHPTGAPVDLPDGVGGTTCTTDANCPSGQHCFTIPSSLGTSSMECRASYNSSLHFNGFGQGQVVMATSDILSVCVNISHEWVRDIEIDLVAPSGQKLKLDKFLGQDCPSGPCEVFLGHPANTDGDCSECTAEMGMDYCWKPTASNPPILDYINASMSMQTFGTHSVLPPGDYQAADAFTGLLGATLNGDWTISVTDLWPIDAGKIHSWTISFNPMIVQTCEPPIQ